MSDKNPKDKGIIIMGPETNDNGRRALRIDEHGISSGTIYDSNPNDLNHDELTQVETQRLGNSSIHRIISEQPASKPSMVNSVAYRNGWDNIFGHKQAVGEA